MRDLRNRRFFVPLLLSFLVVSAGCGGFGGEDNPEKHAKLESQLSELQYQHQIVHDRAETVDSKISTARSRGVSASNATEKVDEASASLNTANSTLSQAQDELNDSNYEAAESLLDRANGRISEANGTLDAAIVELELSYDAAVNQSKGNLQNAYYEYQVAVAYVNDAADENADLQDSRDQLNATKKKIQNAHDAIVSENPPHPKKANQLSEEIRQDSIKVQGEAKLSAEQAIATQDIAKVRSKTESESADLWLEKAQSTGENGELEKVEHHLELAQYAEQVSLYSTYSSQVTTETDVQLNSLNNSLSDYRSTISDGKVPDNGIEPLANEASRSRTCLKQLQIAKSEKRTAMREQAVLIEANFTNVESLLTDARGDLASGDYAAACSNANEAQNESKEIAEDLRNRKDNQLFVVNLPNPFRDAAPIEVAPPELDEIDIESVNLTYSPPSDIEKQQLDLSTNSVTIKTAEAGKQHSEVNFRVNAEPVGECGPTCREAKATLSNTGLGVAHDVTVEVSIFINKDDGDQVWSESYYVGELQPGETFTETDEVSLGPLQATSVKSNGAKIVMKISSKEKEDTITKIRDFS